TPPSILNEIHEWLAKNLPTESMIAKAPVRLIHNDFKLDNIILDPEMLTPTAVIDWDMGTRADPRYDLAILLSYWTEQTDPQVMINLNQMPSHLPDFMTRSQAIERYFSITGLSMDGFGFYRILAIYRLAGIFAQLGKRHKDGDHSIAEFAGFLKLAEDILIFAKDVIDQEVTKNY
ncbi:MAG: phosphotransferase, partial [Alphaproteobacteria bacterium]|nr:phosphotransferase [Alphaproteobacteria bacterium]